MIFGTDGIRGIVGNNLTPELVYKVGVAYGEYLRKHKLNNKVVVGKDTRNSGDMFVSSIIAGLTNMGINVTYVGIVSTPMVSFLIGQQEFAGGIMITASHNDFTYNGIKIFNEFGEKLDTESEKEIDKLVSVSIKKSKIKGNISSNRNIIKSYIDYIFSECYSDLSEKTIVLDCANGSNYIFAPTIFKLMNANIIKCACDNNGLLINKNCGANHIEGLRREVINHKADYGFAFDGDGDRLRIVLSNGRVLDGDDILYIFARYLKQKRKLKNMTIVGTIMTNMGLEDVLNDDGINLIRCDVGDKNVINNIRNNHLSLGGEPSGHICLYEHNCTCDALFNCLYFLKIVNSNTININEILNKNYKLPSITKNISIDAKLRETWNINKNIRDLISKHINNNREEKIIIRPSGTEPIIRIYVEGKSEIKNNIIADAIVKDINSLEN